MVRVHNDLPGDHVVGVSGTRHFLFRLPRVTADDSQQVRLSAQLCPAASSNEAFDCRREEHSTAHGQSTQSSHPGFGSRRSGSNRESGLWTSKKDCWMSRSACWDYGQATLHALAFWPVLQVCPGTLCAMRVCEEVRPQRRTLPQPPRKATCTFL